MNVQPISASLPPQSNPEAGGVSRAATAAIAFVAWGVFTQMVCWAVANRSIWTYGGGKDLGILKYWGIDGVILMMLAVALAKVRYSYRERRGIKNI